MKHILGAALLAVWLLSLTAFAQTNQGGAPSNVNEIINTFLAKEAEFRKALSQYTYNREVIVQTLGRDGKPTGEYRRVSKFSYDQEGKPSEKIVTYPIPSLVGINVTPDDLKSFDIMSYTLDPAPDSYKFKYAGKERIDELDLYVFDVAPKTNGGRRFEGKIWVDEQDLQIVKMFGKSASGDNSFPAYETYREQIDGRYWFPTYVNTNNAAVSGKGQDVKIRMRIRFTEFEPRQ